MKTVIFDMDGLMIDSERRIFALFQQNLEPLGFLMPEEFYKQLLGVNEPRAVALLKKWYGEDFDAKAMLDRIHRELDESFWQEGVPLKPGLLALLKELKKRGIVCAVATSSVRKRVEKILAAADLTGYFSAIVCGDEVTRSKPMPDIFLKALEKTNSTPQEALVLEDSEAGLQAAFAAGIPVICVPDMKVPAQPYADKTLAIMPSLLAVLAWLP